MSNSIIQINDKSPLFNRNGMRLKIFNSDYRLIRFVTITITQYAPLCIRDMNLLEQQICELVKNGAKHGNNYDNSKQLKVWYQFTDNSAHLIVEDEGTGFQELEKWNYFKQLRDRAFRNRDFEAMSKYALWKGASSTETDGGNALFAALEYWNGGVVYTTERNCVGVKRSF